MRNLKLSTRLALFVAFVMAMTLAIGAVGLLALRSAQSTTEHSLRQSQDLLDAVDAARRAQVAFQNQVQEYKNILLRGHETKDLERYTKAFQDRTGEVEAELSLARAAFDRLGLPVLIFDEARQMHTGIVQHYAKSLEGFEPGKLETGQAVDTAVRGKSRPLEEKIDQVVKVAEQHARQAGQVLRQRAEGEAMVALLGLAVLALVACVAATSFGWWLVRSLLRDLGGEPSYAREVAERIANGDLSVEVQVGHEDRRSILYAMKLMAGNLRGLVGEVADGARSVVDSSAQIAQGNADLSQRTEVQAGTLEATAGRIEQLTGNVASNADRARDASELAVGAAEVASRGGRLVGDVVATMADISTASSRIHEIIGVIDGIAFQTNILALNAAVEAARAGEEGRGFAVVAAEVRTLAQRSAAAAREIKTLIADAGGKVEAGSRQVAVAGATMQEIVASVTRVSELLGEVSVACREQTADIAAVNTAVAQMDQATQQNASLVEEAAAATESMKQQADTLLHLIGRFRIARSAQEPAGPAAPSRAPRAPARSERAKRAPQLVQAFAPSGHGALPLPGGWKEF